MIVAGVLLDKKEQHMQIYRGHAEGTVVEIVAGEPDEEGIRQGIHDYYYPVVAYYANGRLYRTQSPKGSNPSRYYERDRVQVRYIEQDPEQILIEEVQRKVSRARQLYYGGFLVAMIGGIFFLLFATRG
ncbi:MAG: DUF3592 domain-containing protein [Eubacteriales bacterium]|nr:DUF3592 domain-containing protein [Eubacteriales bacterium]